jgi:hypothetical protein
MLRVVPATPTTPYARVTSRRDLALVEVIRKRLVRQSAHLGGGARREHGRRHGGVCPYRPIMPASSSRSVA